MMNNDADRWRRRAEEARALVEGLNGDQAKVAMLRVADEYDNLVRRAEERRANAAEVGVSAATVSRMSLAKT
jgi:hypothetical protein